MKTEKVRVHEFAKQHGVPSKEILKLLKDGGFDVGSHMSILDQKALTFLNQRLLPSEKPKKEKSIKSMSTTTQPRKKVNAVQSRKMGNNEKSYSTKSSPELIQENPLVKELTIEPMTPDDVAKQIGEPATGVILTLLKMGVICPKNQILPEDIVKRLAQHYSVAAIKKVSEEHKGFDAAEKKAKGSAIKKDKLQERLPVVVVMGHVDHGKTTLLDFVRKTRVAAKEKGGITQHIGAYEVKTSHGGIVFLDTPGHEAFTKIRMRGAKVADIVVLVIAADDSIMPQTVEAIRHAKAMEVPIIVAINKIDKVEQYQIEAVKRDLSQHDLLPEEWGGQVVCVPISAKLGQGVDELLEMIALQAQVMGLEADKSAHARGYILESKLEKGRGPVATLISQHGTIKKGDFFICGETSGRVNSLIDSHGNHVSQVGPSIPIRVAGFSELPEAGDFLQVVSQKEYRVFKSSKPEQRAIPSKITATEGDINLLVKTDTKSSREALIGAISKLSKKLEKGFHIIHSAVGDISEGDIALASTTGSLVVGLHIKLEPNAALLARRSSVDVRLFDIIYKLIENLEEFSESKKEIKKVKAKIGEAVVLRVFDIKNVGVIAGCAVKDGRCTRDSFLVVWRGKTKVGEGKIKSLQREKKSVKEVHAGFECGFLVNGLNDWEVDDRIECYIEVVDEGK